MKVLWFSPVQPSEVRKLLGYPALTGQASWVDNLQRALVSKHDIELGIATFSEDAFKPFICNNVMYYCIPWLKPKSKLGVLFYAWKHYIQPSDLSYSLNEVINDFRPEIIHVHGTENPFGLITNNLEIPVIISLQGILFGCLPFVFSGINTTYLFKTLFTKNFLKGIGMIHGYFNLKKRTQRELEIFKMNKYFIGRTLWDKSLLQLVNPGARYYHVEEIIRPCFYEGEWENKYSSIKTIFTTSSAMIWKGTEILLKAISILINSGCNDIKLRIAGVPKHGEYSNYLHKLCYKLGIDDQVYWLGRLDSYSIMQEVLQAGMFVYPTHIDNSPNALVEAMLLGVPCIASYSGGIPSLLNDGKEGLLFQVGDAYSLAGKITELILDRTTAITLGKNARNRAIRRNNPDYIVSYTYDIYYNILKDIKVLSDVLND